MKQSSAFVATLAAALAQSANGHYIFSQLVQDGVASADWQYIRETTRSENYMPTKFTNTYDDLTPNDSDFRCNLGSFSNAANTEVADVAAGDTIAMKLFYDGSIAHPGPGQVYMSKAPGSVVEYEGDGDWFKVWETTICDAAGNLTSTAWCAYGMSQFEFTIPTDTPAGEYLVRAEHVGLHGAQEDEAEFFYSCAQVKVSGSGSGAASTTYQIPGLYTEDMTLFNGLNLWVDSADQIESDISQTPIGDAVWGGGGSAAGSSNSSSAVASAAPAGSSSPVTLSSVVVPGASSAVAPSGSAPIGTAPAYSAPAWTPAASGTAAPSAIPAAPSGYGGGWWVPPPQKRSAKFRF